MSYPDPPNRPEDESSLQVDIYGIKGKVQPSELEPPPKTLRQLWKRLKSLLIGLSIEPFELMNDVLHGARKLVRGLTALPHAIAQRVENAHHKVDRREDEKQKQLEAGATPPHQLHAQTNIANSVEKLRNTGIPPFICEDENGNLYILLVRAEMLQAAMAAGQKTIEAMQPQKMLEGHSPSAGRDTQPPAPQ